jgi:glycosyltransferase involved in cell wall biosynthesis
MRILATCLVKNERDIIEETLAAAARWCDVLYVHDTGSTDGTWEAVLDAASRLEPVVPFKREELPFHDDLRRETFEAYYSEGREGDWWCPLDADEIYIDDPRAFLAAVPPEHGVVWSSCFEFMFTEQDLKRHLQGPSPQRCDGPVEDRLRYYANTWSEPRFYRYRLGQRWEGRPAPIGHPHPVRIRYKHYQYRSPEQIQLRLDTRREALAAGHFAHERREHWARYSRRAAERLVQGYTGPQTWEERIVDSSTLQYDRHDGQYVADEAALPPIEG